MDSRDQAKALGLEESITCFICKKYLSDAVTLNECLHFFCRRCLINHLNLPSPDSRKCPKCKIGLFEPIYRRDPRLQELVYKLVPEHFWQKIKHITSKKHHHSSSRYSSNSPPSERHIRKRRMLLRLSTQLCSLNEKISLQIVYVPLANVLAANNNNSSMFLNENFVENVGKQVGEQIIKQIENVCCNVEQQTPSSSFFPLNIFEKQNKIIGGIEQQQKQHSFNRYFRCSSKVKIQHLKRLLESKLAMTEFYGVYFIDPEFRFVLEDYFTLEDVVQLFSWLRNAPLRLHFTLAQLPPKGDEDRPSALEDMPQLDLESGPMEQVLPIQQQQQQSPPPPPIINTTTMCQDFNEITNKKQIEKNGEKSQEVNNEITKTALASSLISPSICDNSQHTPLLPHSSKSLQNSMTTINSKDVRPSAAFTPPNVSTTMPIPRLSTVGASPLRPVPSLQPTTQQPTNINNNIIKDKPNDGRKRQKNTSNNNIQKKPYQKQEKSKLKNIQQELSEGQQISNSQNLQKETSKPQQIQQEKSKVSQKQKASGERTSLDNGFRNGSSKHTPPPPLTNGSSFINPTIVTNSQQTPQPVVASDYVNFMQNLFQQYHQQQNKQQTSPQFPSFLPANIFGQQTTQQQQQLNSQQMLAMNQMIAMGMFSSGIPFSSEQFSQIPFPFTSTEFLKQNNKKVLQNNNENTTPTKVKKTKSSATSQQNQVIGGNSNHLTKTSTSLSLC